jgi:hypothetical protein
MRARRPARARPRPAPGCARRGASSGSPCSACASARRRARGTSRRAGRDVHRLERGELVGTSSSSRIAVRALAVVLLFIVPPWFARAVLARRGMTASSPVEDKARAGESRDLTTYLRCAAARRRAAPCATCRGASRRGRQRPRRGVARSRRGAPRRSRGQPQLRRAASSGSSLPQVGNAVRRDETGQEIVTDPTSPIDRGGSV